MLKIFVAVFLAASLTLAKTEHDSAHEMVSSIAAFNKLMRATQLTCSGPETESERRSEFPEIESIFCSSLEPYQNFPASTKLTFQLQDPPNVCVPIWKDGISPYLKPDAKPLNFRENRGNISVKGVAYVPPTRSEVLARGYSMATDEQMTALRNETELQLGKMIPICCGDDDICKNAMKEVKFEFCRDPEADKDSTKPDGCYGNQTSSFELITSDSDATSFLSFIARLVKPEQQSEFERGYGIPIDQLKDDQLSAEGALKSPLPGRIQLTPYFKKGVSKASDNLIHEMGHACSAIRRQSSLFRKNQDSSLIATSFANQALSADCGLTESDIIAYRKVLAPISGSSDLVGCIVDMANASKDRTSSTFVDGACPRKHLEESSAEVYSMISQIKHGKLVPGIFPNRLCGSTSSDIHPHVSELFKCILTKTPGTISQLKENLSCRAER
jgi:hypothetical protein